MAMPFPGMDPCLEHPVLWTGVHSGLINAIRGQIAPALRPRYVASVEERVMIDIPTQHYIEILDRYQDLKVVTVIEVVSPINKAAGPGRDEYMRKRKSTLQSSTHLVEIDLLRRGTRVIDFTDEQLETIGPFDYVVTINRFQPGRSQYEIIAKQLRNPLPTFGIPLVAPDPDVALDLQAALGRVYEDGSYMLRVHYERPCSPSLVEPDQQWTDELWTAYKSQHSDLFGSSTRSQVPA